MLCFPFFEQFFAGAPKISIVCRSVIRFAPGNASRKESFGAVRLHHSEATPIDRMPGIGISRDDLSSHTRVTRNFRNQLIGQEAFAIIFEDDRKGFLTNELVSEIAREARAAGKIVAADPNPRHSVDWRGVTVVKPNRAEAFLASGVPWREPDEAPAEDADLRRAGEALLKKWETKYVLITLGEHGMMLFQQNEAPHYIPTKARQVFDVSGAGDTAIALFTLGLVCGATPIEAAEIANHGSAVVVSKLGTATVTRDELIASFQEASGHD